MEIGAQVDRDEGALGRADKGVALEHGRHGVVHADRFVRFEPAADGAGAEQEQVDHVVHMAHFELDPRQRVLAGGSAVGIGVGMGIGIGTARQQALQAAHIRLDADQRRAQLVRHAAQAGGQAGQFFLRPHMAADLDQRQHGDGKPVHRQLPQHLRVEQEADVAQHGKHRAGQQRAAQVGQHGDAGIEVEQHHQRHQQRVQPQG